MAWWKQFWQDHGDRLIFMGMAFAIAVGLFALVPDMRGEAKTVIIGVMTLAFNKARGSNREDKGGRDPGPDKQAKYTGLVSAGGGSASSSGFTRWPLLVVLLAAAVLMVSFFGGCTGGGQSYAVQAQAQGAGAVDVSRASLADANEWYLNFQRAFVDQVNGLPPGAERDPAVRAWVVRVNGLFERASAVLEAWDTASSVLAADANAEQWRAVRYELIDAGIMLVSK